MQTDLDSRMDRLIGDLMPRLIDVRHDLHAHPQLGYQETYAAERVQRELRAAGIDFEAEIAETGIIGRIDAGEGPAVALRADMDALPITELNDLPYKSQYEGCMHACGHDGHTAVLIGAAQVLASLRDQLPRPVRLVFQPAEEEGAGAARMIEAGALEDVGMMFGIHGVPLLPIGAMATCAGPMMAGTSNFHIKVCGRGGHAAMPQYCADPILAASHVVTALQSIVSRNTDPADPAVVTVGSMHGGQTANVIPDFAELSGTFRTMTDATDDAVAQRITEVAQQTAAAFGCTAEVVIDKGYPALHNAPSAVTVAQRGARAALGDDAVITLPQPVMAGEDFAYYARTVPACFSFIGVRPHDRSDYPSLHSPQYDFTDDAIAIGVKLMCTWAVDTSA
ncbi:amidohydrolase [Planctomycetales bacterium ZRK34]|nr:amidohydrolase [Planctomycetales bacterium ZRK34]